LIGHRLGLNFDTQDIARSGLFGYPKLTLPHYQSSNGIANLWSRDFRFYLFQYIRLLMLPNAQVISCEHPYLVNAFNLCTSDLTSNESIQIEFSDDACPMCVGLYLDIKWCRLTDTAALRLIYYTEVGLRVKTCSPFRYLQMRSLIRSKPSGQIVSNLFSFHDSYCAIVFRALQFLVVCQNDVNLLTVRLNTLGNLPASYGFLYYYFAKGEFSLYYSDYTINWVITKSVQNCLVWVLLSKLTWE
jgi:hypothetical protein